MSNQEKRSFTIWKFTGVFNSKTIEIAKPTEPEEERFQHGFQTILGTVEANDKDDALRIWKERSLNNSQVAAYRCPICLEDTIEENAGRVCPVCGGYPDEAGGWKEI